MDGKPGLDHYIVRRLIGVERPTDIRATSQVNDNPVLTVEELSGMDAFEFQLHQCDLDLPGVLLKKDGQCTWTPIATRTRSRVQGSLKNNNCANFTI